MEHFESPGVLIDDLASILIRPHPDEQKLRRYVWEFYNMSDLQQ